MITYKNKVKSEILTKKKIAIVVSEFNSYVTSLLKEGAINTLLDAGAKEENISIYFVPGSFEIPVMCKKIFQSQKNVDGIIGIGAIIQGETTHFDCVVQATTNGIMQVQLEFSKPVIFGVITTENSQQAIERSGLKHGNKGSESASSLIGLFQVYEQAQI